MDDLVNNEVVPVAPSTSFQLLALLAFFVPGLVFEAVRAARRGPSPSLRDTTARLLAALLTSTLLNLLYAAALGTHLLALAQRLPSHNGWVWVQGAAWALFLLFVIPAALALLTQAGRLTRWRDWAAERLTGDRYDPTPSAWDYVFSQAEKPNFLLITLKDGAVVAGLFTKDSFVSGYPDAHEIFLQEAWRVSDTGVIEKPLNRGLWVPGDQIAMLEVIPPATTEGFGDDDATMAQDQ